MKVKPVARPLERATAPVQRSTAGARSTRRAPDERALEWLLDRCGDAHSSDEPARVDTGYGDLVAAAAHPRVQRLGRETAGAGDPAAIAQTGIASTGAPLAHLSAIQRSFGRHDVTGVRAHTGAAAESAAARLGARAYTFGEHVAFTGDTPDLHTAAHEAAHTVQQRAGIGGTGGIDGGPGDPLERHANRVADAVVRGERAEPLLDRWIGEHRSQAPSATVQRQPDPAPTPDAGAPAPPATEPPSRHATMDKISKSVDDADVRAELDIDWIGDLPDAFVRDSIDTSDFEDSAAAKRVKAKTSGAIAQVDKDINAREAALKADATKRLSITTHDDARHKDVTRAPTPAELQADAEYGRALAKLEREREQRKRAIAEAQRETDDAAVNAREDRRPQSVARPGTAQIKRQEGQALSRTNFMSWAIDVMGGAGADPAVTAAKVKAHYQRVEKVTGTQAMYLERSARLRFEKARAEFEAAHPGYTMRDTDEALSLRGLHQTRQGVGMLGHALGEAFDLAAADNPNIKVGKTDSYAYLLAKFGGIGGKRGTGRATMSLGDADPVIEQLGKDTEANKTSGAGQQMLGAIRTQYREMAATSSRFQASMARQLPDLQKARDLVFRKAELAAQLKQTEARNRKLDAAAAAALRNEPFAGDDAARQRRLAEIKARFVAEAADQKQRLDATDPEVKRLMASAFAGWSESIASDIASDRAQRVVNDGTQRSYAMQENALQAVDVARQADPNAALTIVATALGLTTIDRMKTRPKTAAAYKAALVAELAGQLKAKRAKLAAHSSELDADIKALSTWQDRLADPSFVFGARGKDAAGHTTTKYQASSVALIQLLENGFVRSDAMPARDPRSKDGPRAVFNEDAVATLAKWGFAPGATFGDTMHFDFIEGYSAAVPGGRSSTNMQHDRFSPEGPLPTDPVHPSKP